MFSSILVPVDFSEGSAQALRLAIRVARAGGGRITLLHVGPERGLYTGGAEIPAPLIVTYEQLAAQDRHTVERLAREEIPDDVPSSVLTREGFPPEVIVEEAARHDLVVMGTHGRTGLARAVLGSVTERVLRAATVPVLVTR